MSIKSSCKSREQTPSFYENKIQKKMHHENRVYSSRSEKSKMFEENGSGS